VRCTLMKKAKFDNILTMKMQRDESKAHVHKHDDQITVASSC